jgi:hypothetical protein
LARNVKPHGGKQVGILGLGYYQYCALAIAPSATNNGKIWGNTIMRAGCFVFDLDNGQVSVGQARHSDRSQVIAIQAGPHGLASAVNQPQYAQTAQTYPPAPFATALSRNASVSMANLTIGAATVSAATNLSTSEPGRPMSSASVTSINNSAVSSTVSGTLSAI